MCIRDRLLERAVLDALAIAAKAGLVAAGFSKTEAALAYGNVVAVIHAAEASPGGVSKLDGALRQARAASQIAVISSLRSAQLDLALGRPNVIHAALLAGPSTDTLLARFRRLERFRAGDQGESGCSATN